jgi:hypothetical protein
MTAEAFLETTEWADNTPNHIYLLSGDKLLAYIKAGTNRACYFDNPMRIDKRGRQFRKLAKNPFKVLPEKDPNIVEVSGSKGATYFVNTRDRSCSCPGFQFRGKCKHLDSILT